MASSSIDNFVCLSACPSASVCLFACPSVHPYVCVSVYACICLSVTAFISCPYHQIFMKLTPKILWMKCLKHVRFQVEMAKVKVRQVAWSFPCLFCCNIGRWKSGSHGSIEFLLCQFCSPMPISPIYFICVTNTTHEVTMCNTTFPSQRSRSHGSFKIFAMSAPWLRTYLIDSLNMWHQYYPWIGEVSCTISRSKVQRWRSHRLFEVFSVCSIALCLFHRFVYVAQISPMMMMCHTPWFTHK